VNNQAAAMPRMLVLEQNEANRMKIPFSAPHVQLYKGQNLLLHPL